MKATPHLVFNGQALEAANFYATALNAKIENLSRYRDCMPDVPAEYLDKIVHLCLVLNDGKMGLCDACPETQTAFGTGNIVTLHCDSEEQTAKIYAALTEGGSVRCPLQKTFFARQYAELFDRFGVAWCLFLE